MLNKNEHKKQIKKAVHTDMVVRVDPAAEAAFRREPYQVTAVNVKSMLHIKQDINFIVRRANSLDDWEQETIRRIAKRVKEGSGSVG